MSITDEQRERHMKWARRVCDEAERRCVNNGCDDYDASDAGETCRLFHQENIVAYCDFCVTGALLSHAKEMEADRDALKAALVKAEADREAHAEALKEAGARLAQLSSAVLWALGENGEFNGEEPPLLAGKYRQRFWWRKELRQRAFPNPQDAALAESQVAALTAGARTAARDEERVTRMDDLTRTETPQPAPTDRAETGAMQFGDDWPGVFIRGDNAAGYAIALQFAVSKLTGFECAALAGILRLLEGSNVQNSAPVQRMRPFAEAISTPRVPLSEEGKATGSAPQSSSLPARSGARETLHEQIAEYWRIDQCGPSTPWCRDPSASNIDHYCGHPDAKRAVLHRIFAAVLTPDPVPLAAEPRTDEHAEWIRAQCNVFKNGQCSTRYCLRRGGWDGKTTPITARPTCIEREIAERIGAGVEVLPAPPQEPTP